MEARRIWKLEFEWIWRAKTQHKHWVKKLERGSEDENMIMYCKLSDSFNHGKEVSSIKEAQRHQRRSDCAFRELRTRQS